MLFGDPQLVLLQFTATLWQWLFCSFGSRGTSLELITLGMEKNDELFKIFALKDRSDFTGKENGTAQQVIMPQVNV